MLAAAREAGDLAVKAGNNQPSLDGDEARKTLADLGVSPDLAASAVRFARLPDEAWKQMIEQGLRKDGRWKHGEREKNVADATVDRVALSQCGAILDDDPPRAQRVLDGSVTLRAAYEQAGGPTALVSGPGPPSRSCGDATHARMRPDDQRWQFVDRPDVHRSGWYGSRG